MFMLLQQYKVHLVNGMITKEPIGRPVRARGHYSRTRDESTSQWVKALNSLFKNKESSHTAFRVELYDRDEEEYNKKVSLYMKAYKCL